MPQDPRVDDLLDRMDAAEDAIDALETKMDNMENIHGKSGWHQQQVTQALYKRPSDLLIYYGYPNSFNSAVNGWDNEKVAQDMAKYGIIVLGDGVQNPSHGDYSNTTTIIPRVKALNPSAKIFGYVTVNQSLNDFQTKASQWDDLEVHGIFMDEAGYDYGKTRSEFNDRVDYVHGLDDANLCFVNAWNMDHIIGTENDTGYPNSTYNSSAEESNLDYNDWYLLESFPINTTAYSADDGYESKADWAARGVKAINHRYDYNINLAACGIINDDNEDGQDLFDFGFISALMFSLEAFGTSSVSYGASTAQVTFWDRPDVCGLSKVWSLTPSVQVDNNDSDVYIRFVEFGKLLLDFSDSAQDNLIIKW